MVYSSYFVPVEKPVTVRAVDMPLEMVLDLLLGELPIAYEEQHGCVILKPGKPRRPVVELSMLDPKPPRPRQTSPIYPVLETDQEALAERRAAALPTDPLRTVHYESLPGGSRIHTNPIARYAPRLEAIERARLAEAKDWRLAQVSLTPFLSTNALGGEKAVNHLSINIMWGANESLYGLEVGGGVNHLRQDMRGLQVAGLGNSVQGDMKGSQVAGLFNISEGRARGLQAAGLFNIGEEVQAIQLAGVFNIANENASAVQLASLFNVANGKKNGVQLAGLFNVSAGAAKSQGALLFNQARDVEWGQVGLLFNSARAVNGFQLGLLNIADTVSGVSVGLLNIISKGYNKFEIAANEALYANVGFKFGSLRFYNIVQFGFRWDDVTQEEREVNTMSWALGYGLGTAMRAGNRWLFNLEAVGMHVNEGEGWTRRLNLLGQLRLTADVRIGRYTHFFAGPIRSLLLSRRWDEELGAYHSTLPPYTIFQETHDGLTTSMWMGFSGGLRF